MIGITVKLVGFEQLPAILTSAEFWANLPNG
jgi:hypothetical protein